MLSQIDLPDRVVLRITHIDEMRSLAIDVAHALGMMELSLFVCAIDETNLTIANRVHTFHRFFVHYDEPVIRAIRNHQEIEGHIFLLFNTDDFSRVFKVLRSCIFNFLSL